MKCPHCDKEIPGITCPECQESIPEESSYCLYCGADLRSASTGEDTTTSAGDTDSIDFEDRIPCSDGNCIGIIINGKCNMCGRHYKGKNRELAYYMYELRIITQFAAAHQLRNYRGKCEKLHGHNWRIEVFIEGEKLNDTGLLIDFKEVKDATHRILEELDHSFLNELSQFKDQNPSSENIAAYIFRKVSNELNDTNIKVSKVTAWESDSASSSYIG
jgi:6-pyruvoyltetrahydropterin/6-carboxytetrahydropterin synthase